MAFEHLEQKLSLHVPCFARTAGLKMSARLVLAYLLLKHNNQADHPSDRSIHNHTGLAMETISSIRKDLLEQGWWEYGPTEKLRNHCLPAKNNYGYQYFRCYCHAPGTPLSLNAVSLWSYLYHCVSTGRTPPELSYKYFAATLGLGNGTAQNCLEVLSEKGWLEFRLENDKRNSLAIWLCDDLTASQYECLINKRELPEESRPTPILGTKKIDPKPQQDYNERTNSKGMDTDDNDEKEAIYKECLQFLEPRCEMFGELWDDIKRRWATNPASRKNITHREQFPDIYENIADLYFRRINGHLQETD